MNDEDTLAKMTAKETAKEKVQDIVATQETAKETVEVPAIEVPVQAVVKPHEGTLEEQVSSLKGAVAFLASKLPGGYEEIKVLFPHLNLQ